MWALALILAVPTARGARPPGRRLRGAYMGVMVEAFLRNGGGVAPDQRRAAITGVDQDGPACRAGLKSGDVVIAFNGKPVEGPNNWPPHPFQRAGQTVAMTVARDGQSKEMKVTLGDWKQMAGMPKPLPPCPVGMRAAAGAAAAAMYPDIEIRVSRLCRAHGIVVEP